MAESIDFQFPMKKACGGAIKRFCADVPHNHARVIRCLEEKVDDAAMPAECKKEVQLHASRSAQDYRCPPRALQPAAGCGSSRTVGPACCTGARGHHGWPTGPCGPQAQLPPVRCLP